MGNKRFYLERNLTAKDQQTLTLMNIMIDINKFNEIKKTSAKSFNDQKALIKKVMAGRKVQCKKCGGNINLVLPQESNSPGLYCNKGCTNIALDFEL